MADLKLDERQTRLLEWSKAGTKPSVIAEQLGMTEDEVVDEVSALLLLKHPNQNTQAAMELERLDTLNRALWTKVLKGDVPSIARAITIHDRRIELLGEGKEITPAIALQNDMDELMRRTINRSNEMRGVGDTSSDTPTGPKE